MCFLAVCVMTFSLCYNDDDLKNSISGLEDRMDKLEASLQSVQTDISTLKTLTDALSQNKSIASVLENEDGSYTIKFSDKTEVTIRKRRRCSANNCDKKRRRWRLLLGNNQYRRQEDIPERWRREYDARDGCCS